MPELREEKKLHYLESAQKNAALRGVRRANQVRIRSPA